MRLTLLSQLRTPPCKVEVRQRVFVKQAESAEAGRLRCRRLVVPGALRLPRLRWLPLSLLAVLTCLSGTTWAGDSPPHDQIKAYALQLCLDTNYERAGKYAASSLKDESFRVLKYTLWNRDRNSPRRLESFVTTMTSNYYLGRVPLKDEEGRGPFNAIFGQCMAFYRSRALSNFIATEL